MAGKVTLPFENGERDLVAVPQKRPLILLTGRPPQLETPFAVFNDGLITPNDAFFVRYHWSGIPTSVDPLTYRLRVGGKVNGFWMSTAYRIPDNECACVEPGTAPAKTIPINRFNVRSFITSLSDGAKVAAGGETVVRGIAFDGGYGITQVAFSADGGRSWSDARLGKDSGRYSFREWTAAFRPACASARRRSSTRRSRPWRSWSRLAANASRSAVTATVIMETCRKSRPEPTCWSRISPSMIPSISENARCTRRPR